MSSSNMSSERALAIIDRHTVKARPSANGLPTLLLSTSGRDGTHGGTAKTNDPWGSSRSASRPLPTLPAFYVESRDGPSPFDRHKGDAQCSVDCIWASRQDFAVEASATQEGPDGRPSRSHGKGQETVQDPVLMSSLVVDAECGRVACTLEPDHFNQVTHPAVLHVPAEDVLPKAAAPADRQRERATAMAAMRNPLRDRAELQHDVAVKSGMKFVSSVARDRAALYTNCVRFHPHGVLGVRESPYGPDAGAVYGEHQRNLVHKGRHSNRKLLGYTSTVPEDHMKGSLMVCGQADGQGRRLANIAPADHLFGGVNVE